MRLGLAEREELTQCPELQQELQKQVNQIHGLLNRELKRARLAGSGASGSRIDLEQEVNGVIGVLKALYRDKGLEFETEIDSRVVLVADKEDMLELLGNLLDNACKWADQSIVISARADEAMAMITIEDDGPGCTEEEMEKIRDRGMRVDESHVPGYGLGLAIAQDIVGQYRGKMLFSRSDRMGGFQVDLSLPIAGTISQ